MPSETIQNDLTRLLGIQNCVLLAGMGRVANSELVVAVSAAGGLGCYGGFMITPKMLQQNIDEIKVGLRKAGVDEHAWGIDLLLPQVGGKARKTNSDYTQGELPKLVDIICKEKPRLFISAVGVPEPWVVEKLHNAGILYANMVGSPRNAEKALAAGADLLIAQGGEAGGHCGEIASSVLVPQVVQLVNGRKSPLTGGQVHVVAAGGIFSGAGVAMALSLGAKAVWVGSRFVNSVESGASPLHQQSIIKATSLDTIRSTIYSGRPCRVIKDKINMEWETTRAKEREILESNGVTVLQHLMQTDADFDLARTMPHLVGQCAGAINDVLPAKEIIEKMMTEAVQIMRNNASSIVQGNPTAPYKMQSPARL